MKPIHKQLQETLNAIRFASNNIDKCVTAIHDELMCVQKFLNDQENVVIQMARDAEIKNLNTLCSQRDLDLANNKPTVISEENELMISGQHNIRFFRSESYVPDRPGWYVTLVGKRGEFTWYISRSHFFSRPESDFKPGAFIGGITLSDKEGWSQWGVRWWDGKRWSVALFPSEIKSPSTLTSLDQFAGSEMNTLALQKDESVWWTYGLPDGAKRP